MYLHPRDILTEFGVSFPMQKPAKRGAYTTSEIYFLFTDGAFSSHARLRNHPAPAIRYEIWNPMSHFWNWHYSDFPCSKAPLGFFRVFIVRIFSISPGPSCHSALLPPPCSPPHQYLRFLPDLLLLKVRSSTRSTTSSSIITLEPVSMDLFLYPSETLSRKADQCYHSKNQYSQCYSNE